MICFVTVWPIMWVVFSQFRFTVRRGSQGGVNSFYKNIMRSFTGEFDKSGSLLIVVMSEATWNWSKPIAAQHCTITTNNSLTVHLNS